MIVITEATKQDIFGFGEVDVFRYRKHLYVELLSIAKLIQKNPDHIEKWLTANGCFAHEFMVGMFYVKAVMWDTFSELLEYEAQTADNPVAALIQKSFFCSGLQQVLDEAEAKGRDRADTPFGSVRFVRRDGKRFINLDDMATLLDVPPEEVYRFANSQEFLNNMEYEKQLEQEIKRQVNRG
jgi:hypothetical protein